MDDSENLDEFVSLRNIISGRAMEVTRKQAKDILAHPVFGPVNEIVRTPKPEVLTDRSGYGVDGSDEDVDTSDEGSVLDGVDEKPTPSAPKNGK